jgi:hypothetical protein
MPSTYRHHRHTRAQLIARSRSRLLTKPKHKSPTQLSRAPAFLGISSVPLSPISNSPSRNTVVDDTQERLGIENNGWGLLIADDPLRSSGADAFRGNVVSNQSEVVSVH